ncbi:endonuclease Q family protein [Candidatus Woesearchaeota archaeon]|nr:endonuclease Q family protein [Candidatus Woesearchaeota archaeon]
MKYISDLHIHSRFSRATSKQLDIKHMEKYARIKGLNLLGTSDFTHPEWIKELKKELTEKEKGIFRTKDGFPFILQTELSLIYSQDNKGRKVHLVLFAPDFEVVSQITDELLKRGRVDYDGRPIFGIPCPEFVEKMKSISKDIEIIPAHVWTPHFGALGASSGFNSLKECFLDQEKHIFALETGLSSDPAMNWRLSQLDKYTLVSFSDSHSFWPWRFGREACVFDFEKLSYDNILKAVREKKGLIQTLEFWPSEGKYHFDGHRNCNVCLDPKTAMKNNNRCPKCNRLLTIGVAHRVEELADRPEGFKPKNAIPFMNLIPLSEILAKKLGSGVATKAVWEEYYKLQKKFESEYNILLNVSKKELEDVTHPKIVEEIIRNREGKIEVKAGYDGVYGEPQISPLEGKKSIDVNKNTFPAKPLSSKTKKSAEKGEQATLSGF